MITKVCKLYYVSIVTVMFSLLFLFFTTSSCNQDGDGGNGDDASFIIELLTKAEPDECFCGIGAEDNGPISNSVAGDCSDLTPEEPLTVCQPKRNYAYVWSLTKVGKEVWFGTLTNSICTVGSTQFGSETPQLKEFHVCEFEESHVASSKPVPAFGDHRTPQIKVYDTGSRTVQDVSVDNCEGGNELLDTTLGLSQGGSLKTGDFSVVILTGASLLGGVNMFAFDAKTNACLAARNFPEYNDSRKMVAVNGVLYAAVGKTADDDNPDGGGRVLRYMGDLSDPLRWEEVGKLDTIGASITVHEGRIFVGTWPNVSRVLVTPGGVDLPNIFSGPRAGIFMSSIVPPDGLTNANFNDWVKVWATSDYEPDSAVAASYGLADLASFQGRLWWGTINPPFSGFLIHSFFVEPDLLNPGCSCSNRRCVSNPVPDPDCCVLDPEKAPICERIRLAIENTVRITSVFRGRSFDSTPEIELLYGESSLPAFNSSTRQWEGKQNSSSLIPLFGKSGIDNSKNIYTWTLAVFEDHLYLGTAEDSLVTGGGVSDNEIGCDLFRFSDLSSGAEPVSLDGLGNFTNLGIRTMFSDEDGKNGDDALYIGTANPFNLAPEGGWELLRLK